MNSFQPIITSNTSRIGLGLAALGRPGYITLNHGEDLNHEYDPTIMENRTHEMLDQAYEAGIRYVDVAQSYGKAEEFLASWLRKKGIVDKEVLVGSKWGYTYTADWKIKAEKHEVKSHTLDVLSNQWASSKARLSPWLDVYQIHSATFESGVLENSEVLTFLAKLKEEGILVGLSLSGPNQAEVLAKAMEVEIDGITLFGAVQATFNLLEQATSAQLKHAHENGWIVIVKEALANGRLTLKNKSEPFQAKLNILKQEAGLLQTTVDALALAYVLYHPWVDEVLSGAATMEQLRSNLKAADIVLEETHIQRLQALKEDSTLYWNTRKHLAWN
ncbi:MAG: aldo/keto reductase [Bacteroidota bacterium]